ncbi:MAG TPA: MBL fold metallo-hydrolase, partial [bacterium]|nr:MBL fold metallo-hydrolase [bacterium]
FLLETDKSRIMIDCGLYQERELKDRNWAKFPVEPTSIDSIILTHAHLDHCGYLPKIVKDGFKGKIFCTEPTCEIVRITLLDSGKIQEEDAFKKQMRHEKEGRKKEPAVMPLYTAKDAEEVFPLLEGLPYRKIFEAGDGITASFHDAGHILGAGMIELEAKDNGNSRKIIFSGDIGRWNKPILCDPTLFEEADSVFVESTYGNKTHETEEEAGKELGRIINETSEKNGNIVIPTFAIERAQEIMFFLSRLLKENIIPHLLVFVDSPMAIDVTEVFRKYPEYLDKETRDLIKKGHSPFEFAMLKLTRTSNESKVINHIKGSSVIMAGSGMCTGGRIKHHLAANITRPESTIAFVGYQAKGTLGREILGKPETVRILGREYPVRASIENIGGFSAHADRNDLLRWLDGFTNPPGKIFVIHGEEEAVKEFASLLKDKGKSEIFTPAYLDEYTL